MSPHPVYPSLFSPFKLGPFTLKNRIVHASMSTRYVENGEVPDDIITYHASRAEGGAAISVTEPMNLHRRQNNPKRVSVTRKENADGLRRWAAALARHGSLLIAQIQDSGRGRHEVGRNAAAIGASPLPDDISWTIPHELSTDEVRVLIDDWAKSAKILKEAGFAGVEISAGHGHIFHQFFSAWSNRRSDAYGGDTSGRCRFVTDIIAAVRAMCGKGFLIGIKLPGEDGVPHSIGMPESAEITRVIAATKEIDYLTYCWGSHADSLYQHLPDMHGIRAPYVEKIRELANNAPGVPVGALGLITDPNEGERYVREGLADLVMLGRPMVTDPAWGKKAYEGRERQIRYCVSCNTCWHIIIDGGRIQCDNNPRVGAKNEADWWPKPAPKKKKVVVVGSGIAGMEAAWVAAARGHDVTVLAKSGEVGGKTRLHAALPGGENLSSIYDFQFQTSQRFGVKFEYGLDAGLDDVLAIKPDAVVLATGSEMSVPSWVPAEYAEAGFVQDIRTLAQEFLRRPQHQDGTAVVYDHDATAMTYAAAEMLRKRFDNVVILTPRERIASDESLINRQSIYDRLPRLGVRIMTTMEPRPLDRLEEAEVVIQNIKSGEMSTLTGVSLLTYSTSRIPNDKLERPLRAAGIPVHLVGDCYAPRFVVNATAEGHRVGNLI
ncbi:MAG: FAD-dependent oxidoreductase [Alphaproteobacteria bacterium]|nr:FAD-dependent oxidoreductase [Alphaproteobacteria bacterium]